MEKFWIKCKETKTGCWEWQGGRTLSKSDGYGYTKVNGKRMLTHRAAWLFVNGPIPDGMLVCHKCDNPPCCNPEHLFLGTTKDNAMDAQAKGRLFVPPNPNTNKTHCKKGHPLSGENLITFSGKQRARACRICRRETSLRWYHKKAESPDFLKWKATLQKKYSDAKKNNSELI